MPDKYLIINADDFGMCKAANDAVIELFESGNLKSATIMMPCKYAPDAVKFSIDNPQYPIGIHLTTTSEWKSYRWKPLTNGASLVDENGFMWRGSGDFAKHADLKETKAELTAQIQLALDMGMKPSHVDNHMGSLYGIRGNFGLLPTTLKVCRDFGYAYRLFTKPLKELNPKEVPYWLYAAACKLAKLFGRYYKVLMPDYLLFPDWTQEMRSSTYENYREIILKDLLKIPSGITETFLHPALETDELKSITPNWRDRVWEYELMKDPYFHQQLKDNGIELISYKELIEMKSK